MSDWLTALILGTIEGITEFLPISSTGHLKIAEHWVPAQSDLFNIVIQCGAVMAVLPLFPDRLRQIFFRWREPATRDLIAKLFVAFFITCAGGFVLDHLNFKLPERLQPIGWALVLGGVFFLVVERWIKDKPLKEDLTWKVAIAIGLAQLVAAIFPGTSRSGATILFALLLGMSRPSATEFSFLVGIPTMMAAGGWKILKELRHPVAGASQEHWGLLLSTTVISAIVSFIAVKWLLKYVQSHSFTGFGWYRIAAGILVLGLAFL